MDDSQESNKPQAVALAVQLKHRLDTDPEFREQLRQAANGIVAGIQQMHTQIATVAVGIVNGIEALQRQLAFVPSQLQHVARGLIDSFKLLPRALEHVVMTLAQESWFIAPDMSLAEPSEAAVLFMQGEREEGDRHLSLFFAGKLNEIETALCEVLPGRAALITMAFAAHRRGEYALAIPVYLAQVDGICFDLASGSPFQSDRPRRAGEPARPATAAFVDAIEHDVIWTILLSPLGQKIPINFTAKERGEGFTGLNRHMVMHGESMDYGTEVNSLKCISLLCYVAWVLKDSRRGTSAPSPA